VGGGHTTSARPGQDANNAAHTYRLLSLVGATSAFLQ
jgi:hypothetical protein